LHETPKIFHSWHGGAGAATTNGRRCRVDEPVLWVALSFSPIVAALAVLGDVTKASPLALGVRAHRSAQEVVMEDSQVASMLRMALARCLGPTRFELWFSATELRIRERGLAIVSSNSFTRDWLRCNFIDEIRACCVEAFGHDVDIEFEVDEALGVADEDKDECGDDANGKVRDECASAALEDDEGANSATSANATAASDRKAGVVRSEPELKAFVVGKCSEFAFAAATMTARGSQQASPLLLCGPTSVGKTHLLRAMRREFRHHHPRSRAVYLTAEQFTTSFVEALRGTGLPSFRQKCRGADLLLIDDLQFFAGKRASLGELLHTLDALQAEGRQVVLASDRVLTDLRPLGKELISRLAGGLVCEMQLPDFATRQEIVRRLAQEMGLTIGDEVVSEIASQVSAGARELRGALYRLQAVSTARRRPITVQLAFPELADLAQQCSRPVRLADVEAAVCGVFGVESAALRSDRKARSVNEPRMLAMWLARKYTRAPWSEIAQHFGRRSHSTVIAAHRRVEKLLRSQASIGVSHDRCGVEDAIRRVEAALQTA
jgi:chromosomal replication initiator protein